MLRRSWVDATALVGYAAVSFGFFGWRLLPHPGRVILGLGHDPQISIWSFAWWPHAIGSWTNPFVSHALYAPTGVNLAWTPSAPGLALAFSPLTVLVGPVASYNVAAVLLPALSAWTAYLLCRYLTGSLWAALVGGYLYGFSTAMLRQQLLGHLNLTGVFVFPLVALVVVRGLRGELSGRGLAWRLGALLACQLLISTEFFASLTVFLALGLLLTFWLLRDVRPAVRASLLPIGAGYVLAAVFAAPFVYYLLAGFQTTSLVSDVGLWGTDLLAFVVPNGVIGVGGTWFPSVTARIASGDSAYLGLPTLLIVVLLGLRLRREPGARFLIAALATTALLTLGATVRADGHRLLPLPWWNAAAHLPGLTDALPFRLAVYVSLAAAVCVAYWTATTKGRIYRRPYVLPALAVAALVPAVWQSSYPTFHPVHPERWAFFTTGLYEACVPRGETLAVFPTYGNAMLWQAETDFRFRLADNGLQPFPKHAKPLNSFDADPTVYDLSFVDFAQPTMNRLLAFAAAHDVDRFVSVPLYGYPSSRQMRRLGPTALAGGVLVSPACGRASLATRDLTGYVRRYGPRGGRQTEVYYCLGTSGYNLIPDGTYPTGILAGAKHAIFVAGVGVSCPPPPAGYHREGFATRKMGVRANVYPLYVP